MKILIDNGHGVGTKGKRSPDGRLLEYKYAREIAARVVAALKAKGYDAEQLVPEDGDISLGERCARVNAWCDRLGAKNVIVVSVHTDALGMGDQWHDASGLSVRVSPHASAASRRLGRCIYEAAEKYGKTVTGNRCTPPDKVWPQSLYILNATKCPAVLTENLFHTNRADVDFLLGDKGRETLTAYHVNGIVNYLATNPA